MSSLSQLFGTSHPVALVTGSGAPRVGNCVARTLAARGYRVAVHAHRSVAAAERTAEDLRTQGSEAIAVCGDLAQQDDVDRMIDSVCDRFGRIDVLINSAAIWESKPLEEVTADDVTKHFQVNTLGTFLCCQRVGLLMARQMRGGAIVNLGDWAVARPYRDHAAYFPSKGAIPTLTRAMAVELGQRNPCVRVNAILPGPVMLPADLSDAERHAAIHGTLVGREGGPQNVAEAVVALVENDFITGACLPVDGGRSVFAPGDTAT